MKGETDLPTLNVVCRIVTKISVLDAVIESAVQVSPAKNYT